MQKLRYTLIALILATCFCCATCVGRGAPPKPAGKTVKTVLATKKLETIPPRNTSTNQKTSADSPLIEPEPGSLPWVEKIILTIMNYVVYFSQILATFVITVGMIKALWTFIKDAILGGEALKAIRESRIELGHSFSLGLGFLIGASILKTAAAPNWDDIGKLSVIIAIRTILNFFMSREINSYQKSKELDETRLKSELEKTESAES